jgi:hypothetical protein
VMFGREAFSGRLPHAWPRTMDDISQPSGAVPLFPYSYGLTTLGPDVDRTNKAPASATGNPNDVTAGS